MSEKDYSKLASTAEAAVSGIKDPELKRVAFEKILNDMLSTSSHSKELVSQKKTTRKSSGSSPRKKGGGPTAYIEELVAEGYFSKKRSISDVKTELENRGHHIPITSLSGPLQGLCKKRALRREKSDGQTFTYSNW